MTLEVCTRRFVALLKLLCKLRETPKQSLSNPRSAICLGKHLAKYNLDVWKQAGPYVQAVLADVMERFSQDDLHILRPIVLTVWRELLRSDMESTSFSADKLTINSSALPVFV